MRKPLDIIPISEYNISNMEGIYSVKEAADKLGISDRRVRVLLEDKRIAGKKLGHDWVVLSLDYKRKRKPKRKLLSKVEQ
jgi:excisionase family DNA binding protein